MPSIDGVRKARFRSAVRPWASRTAAAIGKDQSTRWAITSVGGTWASAPNINTARYVVSGFAGTETDNLIFGGNVTPGNNPKNATESWDGSTWTSVNNLNTTRRALAGFGTNTAAIGAGGSTTVVDGKYYSQIIGQQSAVTGTSSNGGVVVRQGFKQPTLLERSIAASGIKLNVQEENPITYMK